MKLRLITVWAALVVSSALGQETFIWLEGEEPTSATFPYQAGGWGNREYLSEGEWLHFSISATDVNKVIPSEGALLCYSFEVTEAGTYEVWNRAGFEFVRSPFEWRIDDGSWSRNEPIKHLSTDLMEIARWCEVAWVPMGLSELTSGKHTLEIRFQVEKDSKGKVKRLLYTSDALMLSKGTFRPNGKHKPGTTWRTKRDVTAERHVFTLPETAMGERVEVMLHGHWQYARFDEPGLVGDKRTQPVAELPDPTTLHFSSMAVPGDRNALRNDQIFCHRYILRTQVHVPPSLRGRRLLFDCAEANLMITAFVNGKRVGFSDAVMSGFTFDITDAVTYGAVNELAVVIKDGYYAIQPNQEKPDLHHWFNIPLDLFRGNQGVTHRMDYPTRNTPDNGLLDRVRLIAAGPAVIEDVYFIPSVQNERITVETTIRGEGRFEVVHQVDGKTLAGGAIEGSGVASATTAWPDARFWWPDQPHVYTAKTLLKQDGKVIDSKVTRFGFREWSIEGTRFVLNGVPWQFRADLESYGDGDPEATLARWRETGQNMFRLRFQRNWCGMTRREILDFFDTHGVPVRCNVGTFDGQHASYGLVVRKDKKKEPRTELFDNWRKQVRATVWRERNHPCVFVWELDNEIIYINARNFGNLDGVEPEFKRTAELVASLDRQGRGQMVAGGRALMDQSLPVNGCHYEASADRDYPDMAYGLGGWTEQSGKQPWPMAADKPIFLSEEAFLHGRKPQAFAGVGGERCFAGRSETKEAGSFLLRMYSEGYRWQALGGFHYWCSGYGEDHYKAWQPVCVLVREWTRVLPANSTVTRTVMVRNDTRFDDPITFMWRFGQQGDELKLRIPPGHGQIVTLNLKTPPVADRTNILLHLACRRNGQVLWTDTKPLSVLNAVGTPLEDDVIAVLDPDGGAIKHLKARGANVIPISRPEAMPDDIHVLIIGHNALSARQSTDPMWLALARHGTRLVVLEQEHPLHYQAVQSDIEPTDYDGRMAFIQEPGHPVFAGLVPDDFVFWPDDHIVYRHIYRKPTRGARSLLHADDSLAYCALAECPAGEGLMLLCQAAVGEKLTQSPVAGRLLDNMVNRALKYKRIRNRTVVCLPDGDPRLSMLSESGLVFERLALETALQGDGIVIVDATPTNLDVLAVRGPAFAKHGGTLMVWGLTPAGLTLFNELVDVDHLLRPFRREKVQLAVPRPSLAAGISQSDVALSSGERIVRYQSIEWAADDTFSYVVDLDDIAPFMDGPGIEPDHNGGSIVNGFTDAEFWRYICYFSVTEDNKGPVLQYELPRAEHIVGFSIVPNSHYKRVREFVLTPDGDTSQAVTLKLEPYERDDNPRQDLDVDLNDVKRFTLAFTKWDEHERPPLGIDNLWLRVKRPDDFTTKVKPIVENGGLVYYPEARVLLNQIAVPEREKVPVNREKKQRVVETLLRNLNAVFEGSELLVSGEDMKSEPVSLEGKCNLYLTEAQGWPIKEHDLAHLPLGQQHFAGVWYEIRDFQTSPLESAITLQGLRGIKAPREVTDISVQRQADAVFFLHTFIRKREWTPRRKTDLPPVLFQYVIHYSDDSSETVDVRYGLGVEHWRQEEPKGLHDAALAWASEGAAVYSLQWNNPHPEKNIARIDLRYEPKTGNRYGTPVVLGISTGLIVQ